MARRLALSTRLGRQHRKVMATSKLGSGARFRSLVSKLKRRGGVRNPRAVAASIGRRKYGVSRFARLSAKGRLRG